MEKAITWKKNCKNQEYWAKGFTFNDNETPKWCKTAVMMVIGRILNASNHIRKEQERHKVYSRTKARPDATTQT